MNLYQKRRSAWIAANGPCKKCGSTDDLEVDHINPESKTTDNIWSYKHRKLQRELQNCQVLCHSCHRAKTLDERKNRFVHGEFDGRTIRCRCPLCIASYKKFVESWSMKKNEFRCFVCGDIRERGVFIRVNAGAFKDNIIKVCKRAECAKVGKMGELWVQDPLNKGVK